MQFLKHFEIDLRTSVDQGSLVPSLWHRHVRYLQRLVCRITHLASQIHSLLLWYLQVKTATPFWGIVRVYSGNARKRSPMRTLSVIWQICRLLCAGKIYTATLTAWMPYLPSILSLSPPLMWVNYCVCILCMYSTCTHVIMYYIIIYIVFHSWSRSWKGTSKKIIL